MTQEQGNHGASQVQMIINKTIDDLDPKLREINRKVGDTYHGSDEPPVLTLCRSTAIQS
jgi:hypothetical protein